MTKRVVLPNKKDRTSKQKINLINQLRLISKTTRHSGDQRFALRKPIKTDELLSTAMNHYSKKSHPPHLTKNKNQPKLKEDNNSPQRSSYSTPGARWLKVVTPLFSYPKRWSNLATQGYNHDLKLSSSTIITYTNHIGISWVFIINSLQQCSKRQNENVNAMLDPFPSYCAQCVNLMIQLPRT